MLRAENFSNLLITFPFLAKFTNQIRERHQFALEGLGVSGRKRWIHAPIKGEIAPRPLTSGNQVSCDTQAVERKISPAPPAVPAGTAPGPQSVGQPGRSACAMLVARAPPFGAHHRVSPTSSKQCPTQHRKMVFVRKNKEEDAQ